MKKGIKNIVLLASVALLSVSFASADAYANTVDCVAKCQQKAADGTRKVCVTITKNTPVSGQPPVVTTQDVCISLTGETFDCKDSLANKKNACNKLKKPTDQIGRAHV